MTGEIASRDLGAIGKMLEIKRSRYRFTMEAISTFSPGVLE